MSSKPPNQGPPGLQYPRLHPDAPVELTNAVRNIFDNLFYIRGQLDTPSKLSPAEVAQVRQIVSGIVQNFFNTVNNITNNITVSGCIVGTHNLRITTYGAASQAIGTLFFETDRHYLYLITPSPKHWSFVAGVSIGVEADLWTDLGSNDTGAFYFASDTETLWIWNGAAWVEISGGGATGCCSPMTTGADPMEIMDTGAGEVLLIEVD